MTEKPQLDVSPEVSKNKFEVCERREGKFVIRYTGDIRELADCLFGLGISAQLFRENKEAFLVLNEEDYDKLTEGPNYDC